MPAWEFLIVNERISHLIREGNIHQIDNVIETGVREGMRSMDRSLIELYQRGLIDNKELLVRVKYKNREELRNIISPDSFPSGF